MIEPYLSIEPLRMANNHMMINTDIMAKREKKKKINITIPEWLWEKLMKQSKDEYMPMATYSRRLLIDAFKKNNTIIKPDEDEI